MKQKLSTVFILITLALIGIVIFQAYWAVSAYRVNKQKFNADIDLAMQRAMDSCKKDYFDSVRTVLVKRLSAPEMDIKLDTPETADTAHASVMMWFNIKGSMFSVPTTRENAFSVTKPVLEYYRKMIPHKNPTLPEVLTEMSFYVPALAQKILFTLGTTDINFDFSANRIAKAAGHVYKPQTKGIYTFPANLKATDSTKLANYYRRELKRYNVDAPFTLHFTEGHHFPVDDIKKYALTNEYSYKYHGFKMFSIVGPEYFARASFANPGYAVLKGMTITLVLSALLILFTIYCFYYVLKLIMQQKKLAELKDDFINNMTHELKTPIATITAAVEGLQSFNALDDRDKASRYLQTSKNELDRLNALVTRVLDTAALENHSVEMVKEAVDLDDLINDVINTESLKTSKQVTINYQNVGGLKQVQADRLHFRNVLVNLVDNAIKYCKEPVTINISADRKDGYAVISVKDTGPGIAAEHLGHIFEKFYRVPTGNVHNVKGTGLGLNYVKSIVEAHNGSATAKSNPNSGSEFIVSIPLA